MNRTGIAIGRLVVVVGAVLALPALAHAQEAVLTGAVTDSTGGVLPGVTVTAVLDATGNTFVAVTDERGIYRIPSRVGEYRITAELPGFATVVRPGIQLLVGQILIVNLQMSPSTIEETVTVTAEAPLLNIDSSSLGGNIDPKQVQEMPVQGRDWSGVDRPHRRGVQRVQQPELDHQHAGKQRAVREADRRPVSHDAGWLRGDVLNRFSGCSGALVLGFRFTCGDE